MGAELSRCLELQRQAVCAALVSLQSFRAVTETIMTAKADVPSVSDHLVSIATRRRLLFVSTDMGMGGGAEEQVILLAYALQSRGWEICIVSLLPPSPMPADFPNRGIPLLHLGMRRGIPDPRSLWRLARIIREFRPDVVHSHLTHANLLARAVRIFQPYPILVCTLHALNMAGVEHDRGTILEIAHRLTDSLADRTTAICHAAANHAVRRRAVPASKMSVVHNGIDTNRYAPRADARQRLRREMGIGEQEMVWLAAGRLEPSKAYPTLLEAFAIYKTTGDCRRSLLLICGEGSLRDRLISLARQLNVSENVRFLGLRGDIPDVMSAADAFALSSDLEGLPLVLLQASAAGLPIVATDVAGNSEAVAHGLHGYIVPPGDSEAFARAMVRIASLTPAERVVLGEAGRVRVRQLFEMERIADQWEELYAELLDAVGGKGNRSEARRRTSSAVG